MDNIQYVYVYLDPRKPGIYVADKYTFKYEPIYIGAGRYTRINDHINEALNKNSIKSGNKLKFFKLKSILSEGRFPIIFKIEQNLDEVAALELEKKLISKFGKIIDKTGILTNICDGGIGGPKLFGELNPMFGVEWTIEDRQKQSARMKVWWDNLSEEEILSISNLQKSYWSNEKKKEKSKVFSGKNNPMYGKNQTDITKRKISIANSGKFSGNKNPNIKTWKITSADSKEWIILDGMELFFESIGYTKKDSRIFRQAILKNKNIIKKGKFKNWKVEKLDT